MDKRYFRIIGATKADREQILNILRNKTFYPESTSTPPLPGAYVLGFDYRQFFILVGIDKDGYPIVFTRQEWTVPNFNIECIPTADWTTRYQLSIAPTIEALPNYTTINWQGVDQKVNINAFLSYDYQLYNNK